MCARDRRLLGDHGDVKGKDLLWTCNWNSKHGAKLRPEQEKVRRRLATNSTRRWCGDGTPPLATAGRQSDRCACCILEYRIRCYRGCMTTASDRSILNETGKSAVHDVAERRAYGLGHSVYYVEWRVICAPTASTSCRTDNSCRAGVDFLPTFLQEQICTASQEG